MHDAQSRTEVYLLTERHKGHILGRRAGGREEFGGLKVDFGVLALNFGGFLPQFSGNSGGIAGVGVG